MSFYVRNNEMAIRLYLPKIGYPDIHELAKILQMISYSKARMPNMF